MILLLYMETFLESLGLILWMGNLYQVIFYVHAVILQQGAWVGTIQRYKEIANAHSKPIFLQLPIGQVIFVMML